MPQGNDDNKNSTTTPTDYISCVFDSKADHSQLLNRVIKLLDHGEVELLATLGDDLTVVNSARVSFGHKKHKLDQRDKALMKYLAENKHYSPFRHIMMQFRIKAPEFVMRQWYKHVVGIETSSSYPTKDHAWNEVSGRYTEVEEFYYPSEWRQQSQDNKQASNGTIDENKQNEAKNIFSHTMEAIQNTYQQLISMGVSREQARIILPLNQFTEVYWTASFQAIANFIELRDHSHAQWEIREYAKVLAIISAEIFPETYRAWFNAKLAR